MNLPSGTVTFLFTDIEGSTKLWEDHPEAMRTALARHDALLRQAIKSNNGVIFKTIGDAFCAAFSTAPDALAAALATQRALVSERWEDGLSLRVRMALHTGAVELREGDYFGQPLNRVARLLATGHGGQVLLSNVTHDLARDHLPSSVTFKNLGEHRLRDLGRPETVFQLLSPDLPSEFPPLRSLESPELTHNLPVQVTSFVGREKEMAEVTRLLSATRMLTLTGSGGCGKTRLALQVAADLQEQYPDGVWLVELASLSNPGLVPHTLAQTLHAREEPGRPLIQTLTDYLRAKGLLLMLDNCEHLLSACAQLVDDLLRSCPEVKILATSREGLHIAGETIYRVPSLTLLDPHESPPSAWLLQCEAARLFVERATAVVPTFAVTSSNAPALASVCRHLDGIPLAIELAAARVRALPVEQIESRLHDRFRLLIGGSRTALPRQQTLRSLIDWSYDLLHEQEQILLYRLSVFAGGWTLEAAEAVCAGEGIEDGQVLDLLTSLVDKSLVLYEEESGQARYRLLETVRQYADDRLAQAGEKEMLRRQHLNFFLDWAEEIEPKLHGSEQVLWLNCLEQEHDNLRAALEWSQDNSEDGETGLRLSGALSWFWHLHGHLSEGRGWLESILVRPEAQRRTKAHAKALHGAGNLAFYQNDRVAARSLLGESAAIWRELGDKRGLAAALPYLGSALWWLGEREAGIALLEENVALGREIGDKWVLAMALWCRALFHHLQDEDQAAQPLLEESIALYQEVGDAWGQVGPLIYLGEIHNNQGDFAKARARLEEALVCAEPTGDKWRISITVDTLGEVALSEGDYRRARALFEKSLAMCREIGNNRRIAYELRNLGHVARFEENYTQARSCYAESLVLYHEVEDRRHIANVLDAFARLAAAEGQAMRAARLFGAVEVLREAVKAVMLGHERKDYDSTVAAAREALGAEAFAAAWSEGQAMTMEQAITYALEEGKT